MVRLIPLAVVGYFHFILCKFLFGFVVVFNHSLNPITGEDSNPRARPYWLVSVLLTGGSCIALILNAVVNSYFSLMADSIIILAAFTMQFVFLVLTNLLIKKDLVRFREIDPYFYIQTNSPEDLGLEAKQKRVAFNRKVLKFVYFLAALGIFPVLISAVRAPLQSDFTLVAADPNLVDRKCLGSPVLWSGTRSIVFRCGGSLKVIQGPENVVLSSGGRKTLEQTLIEFIDPMSGR